MILIKNKKRFLVLYSMLVILLLFTIFTILQNNKNNRIDSVLKEQIEHLNISYNQGADRFNMISDNVYLSMQNDEKFLDMFYKAVNADDTKRDILRDEMYKHLESEYRKLKMLDVMQVHLILPNNISFLRMHRPAKFGDDLSDVRYSIKSVNELNIHIHGFEGGKTTHGFRQVFPIYKDGIYIGAIDVAFSSTVLQSYTMRASGIHTHFIVNKDIFELKEWKSNTQHKYHQSNEHEDFLFSMSHHMNHDRLDKTKKTVLEPLRDVIDSNVKIGKKFAIYKELEDTVMVVAFLPIRNIKNDKTAAYLVSYRESEIIVQIIDSYKYVLIFSLVGVFIISVLLYQFLINSHKLKKELEFDGLTRVFNRKHFMHLAEIDYHKSKELSNEISIVMMDIDFFKKVNDDYGHQDGDTVLQEISSLVNSSIRKIDFIGRYGGEEFILLINANKNDAKNVIENIRKTIQEHQFCSDKKLKITASFGIAQGNGSEELQDIIKNADVALYKSKNEGRNRVTVF